MKVLVSILLVVIACLAFARGEDELGLRKLDVGKINHCWFYGLTKAEAAAEDSNPILDDSIHWLIENKFVEFDLVGEGLTDKEMEYTLSRWFGNKFKDVGVMLIRVNPEGYVRMAVASVPKLEQHRYYWAKMVERYEPLVVFINSHPKNIAAIAPARIERSFDEDIKRLMNPISRVQNK